MFNIKVDKVLSEYLSEKRVRLEELFVLACYKLDSDLLRSYLKGRNKDQMAAYLQPLERKMLLRRNSEDYNLEDYELTELGDQVFSDCKNIYDGDIAEITKSTVTIKGMTTDEFDQFVVKYLTIFPEGVKNKGGEVLRSHPVDVTKRMKQFLEKYKYDVDTVLNATDIYMRRMSTESYLWCSSALFFITKNGVSKLAAECEQAGNTIGDDWDTGM